MKFSKISMIKIFPFFRTTAFMSITLIKLIQTKVKLIKLEMLAVISLYN